MIAALLPAAGIDPTSVPKNLLTMETTKVYMKKLLYSECIFLMFDMPPHG